MQQQQQQQPTLTNIRIRTVDDVHRVFYAVHQGILPIITRRLDDSERKALVSGNLYVFEDRGQHAVTGVGIERFTEGKHWSASRVRDEFLFYYEQWAPKRSRNQGSSARGTKEAEEMPPRDWEPMVKQTYTAWMTLGTVRRRFHMIYYWRQSELDVMRSVDEIESLLRLNVPQGIFRTSRTSNRGRGRKATNPASNARVTANPPRQSSSSEQQASTSNIAPTITQFDDIHLTNQTSSPNQSRPYAGALQGEMYPMPQYTPEFNYSAPPMSFSSASQASHHPQLSGYNQQNGVVNDSIYVFSTPQAQTSEQHLSPPPAPNISMWPHASSHDHVAHSVYHSNEALYMPDPNSPSIPMSYVGHHLASPPSSGSSLSSPHSHSASEYSGSSPIAYSLGHQIPQNAFNHVLYSPSSEAPHPSPTHGSSLPRSPFVAPDTNQYDAYFPEQPPGSHVHSDMAGSAPGRAENINPVGLAPLNELRRFHPYRRDPTSDQAIIMLDSKSMLG